MIVMKEYITISIYREIFNELYLLKAMLLKGSNDKSWNAFMHKVVEITNDYINKM